MSKHCQYKAPFGVITYPIDAVYEQLLDTELSEYFGGKRTCFSNALCDVVCHAMQQVATPFQQKVWKEMMRIPYGKTCTYGELAKRISQPKAARAIGGACHNNPFLIIVPCHRVLSSHSMGGFALGLSVKQELLRLEQGTMCQ